MRSCVIAALLGVQLCVGAADAQIITTRNDGDKTITCTRIAPSSDLRDCGPRPNWYNYVFVGSISSVTPTNTGEERLLIVPEEIFSGNPAAPLTVITSQAACLPKMTVGDHWLFFLREENGNPIVLDYYANDSLPAGDAQDEIERLRLLENIGERGIVQGRVMRGTRGDREPVADAVVVADGGPADLKFTAATDANGRYEFPPLPAGEYRITVDQVDPLGTSPPAGASVRVRRSSCWDLTLAHSPHAEISGRVRYTIGSPVAGAQVLFMHADGSSWTTYYVDANGRFRFDSLDAGSYVIGIRLPGDPPWEYGGAAGVPPPVATQYYPGVPDRASAATITLKSDEKRDDINFTVPTK
ncbi:MAG: carboxypeptidase-like regulatory domain-containing protein [Candidatus Acidiferrales bacterium]